MWMSGTAVVTTGSKIIDLSYNSVTILLISTTSTFTSIISRVWPLPNYWVIFILNISNLSCTLLSWFANYISTQGFTPYFMIQTLVSNMPSLFMYWVHIACGIIIKPKGIPLWCVITDCTSGGALDVHATSKVYVVSVYPPISIASTVSTALVWVLYLNISTSISISYIACLAIGLVVSYQAQV